MERATEEAGIGFRRWYERQLIESHAWFVTCVLCLIAAFACLEQMTASAPPAYLLVLGLLVFAAGALAFYGARRYRAIMTEAERLADRSVCEACNGYGHFRVPRLSAGAPFEARCRCGNRWRIE
ncbi:MAG: hypothetical protein N2653_01215 [Burkholderiales bacterium]|nr:hypothetical protein [Burkholderiales bacterium]